jgi:hypothetical protein
MTLIQPGLEESRGGVLGARVGLEPNDVFLQGSLTCLLAAQLRPQAACEHLCHRLQQRTLTTRQLQYLYSYHKAQKAPPPPISHPVSCSHP